MLLLPIWIFHFRQSTIKGLDIPPVYHVLVPKQDVGSNRNFYRLAVVENMISRRSLLAGMAGSSFMARSPKAQPAQLMLGRRETFSLDDSLLFIGKPDRSSYGLKRSRTVYENELLPPKRSAIPNETAVRSKARAVLAEGVTAAVPVILDVEQYSVDIRLDISHINPDTSTVDANIPKLKQIIGWFKH